MFYRLTDFDINLCIYVSVFQWSTVYWFSVTIVAGLLHF